MAFNQTVSLGVGLVPLVGDLCAAVWKTNSRNAALLEEFLIARAAKDSEGNPSAEAQVAASVLNSAKISGLTGERTGGPPAYSLSAESAEGTQTPPEAVAGARTTLQPAQAQAQKGKSFYGWGGGSKTAGASGATAQETRPLAASGATAGTSAGPGPSKLQKSRNDL